MKTWQNEDYKLRHEIIPSPGTENKTWTEIEQKIDLVKPFAKTIHIDIIDGKFAPTITLNDPAFFSKYANDFILEVHLMVEEPINYLQAWADVGVRRFIGQIEKMSDQAAFVAKAQLFGEVSLALNTETAIESLTTPLDDLDSLLIMTVKAGLSGQKFIEGPLEKVKKILSQTAIPIEVDGGINDETIEIAAASGATRFVATSFLFNNDTPLKQYQLLIDRLATVTSTIF
jgi:ribulose-phosphate 3-epimerase